MKTVSREVKTMMIAVECECGGVFTEPCDSTAFLTYPMQTMQKDFKCNKCDKIERLSEPCFPKLVYV